jgi:hypothetical protein
MPPSVRYEVNHTLEAGHTVTTVTVGTDAKDLATLLAESTQPRQVMPNRKVLKILNTHGSAILYITDSPSQAATDGWPIPAGGTYDALASETFTANLNPITTAEGGGFYLITASGTISAKIMQAK